MPHKRVVMEIDNVALGYTNSVEVLLVEGDGDVVVALSIGKASAAARPWKKMKWTRESAGQNRIFSNSTQRKIC